MGSFASFGDACGFSVVFGRTFEFNAAAEAVITSSSL